MQQHPNAARRESAPRVVRIGQWYAAADDPAVAAAIRLLESAEEPTSPLMELTDDMLLKVARLLLDDNLPAVFSLSGACRQLYLRLQPVCVEARARRLRWAMAGAVGYWDAGCYINNRICTAQGTIDTVGGYAVGPVIPPGRRVEFTVTFVGGEYRRSADEDKVRLSPYGDVNFNYHGADGLFVGITDANNQFRIGLDLATGRPIAGCGHLTFAVDNHLTTPPLVLPILPTGKALPTIGVIVDMRTAETTIAFRVNGGNRSPTRAMPAAAACYPAAAMKELIAAGGGGIRPTVHFHGALLEHCTLAKVPGDHAVLDSWWRVVADDEDDEDEEPPPGDEEAGLKRFSESPSMMWPFSIKWTVAQVKQAGWSPRQCFDGGFSLKDVVGAGWDQTNKDKWVTPPSFWKLGFQSMSGRIRIRK